MGQTKKAYLVCNESKERAVEFNSEISEKLPEIGVYVTDKPEDSDFAVVIGGDGTLLKFARYNVNYVKPVVAVNMGSLGFLTDVRTEECLKMVERIISGNFRIEKRYFLEAVVNGKTIYALNDIVVSKAGTASRMVTVKVMSNDDYLNTYRADGIIIASPTGSTAYSLSCGGPIMVPGLEAILVTPIAVHNLNARPIVLSKRDRITLSLEYVVGEAHLMIDGESFTQLLKGDTISVNLSGKYIMPVLYPGRTFFGILKEKLRWGEDPVIWEN